MKVPELSCTEEYLCATLFITDNSYGKVCCLWQQVVTIDFTQGP